MEAPHLQRLHRTYFPEGLRIVGVTQMNPEPAQVRAFRKRYGITYPAVLDPGEKVGQRYLLEGHPTSVLVDPKGVVRAVHTGYVKGDEAVLEQEIRRLLGLETGQEAR